MKFKIATIIVTYNGLQWIEDCINSVVDDTQVIVVDNASKDDTVNFIKDKYKDVILIENKDNHGFGKANNIGIAYALKNQMDYVLLLNQDAKMEKGSLEKLFLASKKHKDFGIISPIHCNWNGDFLESSFANYCSYQHNKHFYSDHVLSKSLKSIYEVPFIAAACWLLTREVLESVGGFDPIFKHLGEDVNLSQRVRYHGFKIGIIPTCIVMHDTDERVYDEIEKFSERYFYKLDYRNKMKYADLTIPNWEEKLNYAKSQIKKEIFISLVRFRFSHVKCYLKQIKQLHSIKSQCTKSREINKNKGSHYLN